jgi:hypothetical protein
MIAQRAASRGAHLATTRWCFRGGDASTHAHLCTSALCCSMLHYICLLNDWHTAVPCGTTPTCARVVVCAPLYVVAADPTPAEVAAGVNLADVGKCNCSARYCAPAVTGSFMISNSSAAETVTLNAALPPFPFADGPGEAACTECELAYPSSSMHAPCSSMSAGMWQARA